VAPRHSTPARDATTPNTLAIDYGDPLTPGGGKISSKETVKLTEAFEKFDPECHVIYDYISNFERATEKAGNNDRLLALWKLITVERVGADVRDELMREQTWLGAKTYLLQNFGPNATILRKKWSDRFNTLSFDPAQQRFSSFIAEFKKCTRNAGAFAHISWEASFINQRDSAAALQHLIERFIDAVSVSPDQRSNLRRLAADQYGNLNALVDDCHRYFADYVNLTQKPVTKTKAEATAPTATSAKPLPPHRSARPAKPSRPCAFCGAMHWHDECPRRNAAAAPTPTTRTAPARYGRSSRDTASNSAVPPAPAAPAATPRTTAPGPAAAPAPAPAGAKPAANSIVCFNCQGVGHTSRDCPAPRRDRAYLGDDAPEDRSRFMELEGEFKVNGYLAPQVVFDTGSTTTLVNKRFAKHIYGKPRTVSALNGTYTTLGETEIDFKFGDNGIQAHAATVAPNLPCDLVVGLPFFTELNAVIDFKNRRIVMGEGSPLHATVRFYITDRHGRKIPPVALRSTPAEGDAIARAMDPGNLQRSLEDVRKLNDDAVTEVLARGRHYAAMGSASPVPPLVPKVTTLPVEITYEDPAPAPLPGDILHTEITTNTPSLAPSLNTDSTMVDELDPAPEFPEVDIVKEKSRDLAINDSFNVCIGSDCPPEWADALRTMFIEENAQDVLCPKLLHHGEALVEPVRLGVPADAKPIQTKPRRDSPVQRQLAADWAAEGLRIGLLEPSTSSWRGNVVFAKKPDGGIRPCADISHTANRYVGRTAIQLPRIEDVADSVKGCRVFSRIDFVTGYQQLPLHPDDRQYTAIWVDGRLLQFRALPMGFTNSGAIFHQTIAPIFREVDWDLFFLYVDDGLIGDDTFERHLEHLRKLIRVCRKYNLKLNSRKSIFFADCLSFIGHVISNKGLSPDPNKVAVIRDARPPTDKTGVQSYLGLANFCRNYVKNFADLAAPLIQLTHKDTPFEWTAAHQHAFEALRDALCSAPCLALPDMERPFILKTDASNVAAGAVLAQLDDSKNERPVAYFSKTFTAAQRKYTATERELFAGVLAMRHFHPYLHSATPFRWVTDHAALQYIKTLRINNTNPLRMRWLEYLDQFTFTVQYRAGAAHSDADALSRPPIAHQDHTFVGPRPSRATAGKNPKYDEYVTPKTAKLEALAKRQAKLIAPPRKAKARASPEPKANAVVETGTAPPTDEEVTPDSPPTSPPRIDVHPIIPTAQADIPRGVALRTLAVNLDGMAEEQRKDPQLSPFFDAIGQGAFSIIDGLLVRDIPADHRLPFRPYAQLVLPASRRHDFMREIHDTVIGGHFGIRKTLHTAQRVAWWPTLREDVTHWVKTCTKCNASKPDNHSPFGKVADSTPHARLPWEVASIDLIGPLPRTTRGNRYIATCTCEATGDLEVWASASASAEDFVDGFVTNVVCRGKTPSVVRTDKGPAFRSAFLKEVCKQLRVRINTSGGYHTNFVGLAERSNRTVNHFLRVFTEGKLEDWDLLLPAARLAIISSIDESRGDTPFFLNHIRDARTPLVAALEARIAPPSPAGDSEDIGTVSLPVTYKTKMLAALHHALALAAGNLVKARLHQRKYANSKRADDPFQEGDLVYLNTLTNDKARNEKYRRQWEGPFRIHAKVKDNIYQLVNVTTGYMFPHEVHASRLREFVIGSNRPAPDFQLPDDDVVYNPGEEQLLSPIAPDDLDLAAQDALDDAFDPVWDTTKAAHLSAEDAVPDDTPVLIPVFNDLADLYDEFHRRELDALEELDPSESDAALLERARSLLTRILVGDSATPAWIFNAQHRTSWSAVIAANLTMGRMRRLLAHILLRFARIFEHTITALRSQARKRRIEHSQLPATFPTVSS